MVAVGMKHAGPPLSKVTMQLSRLAVDESVVIEGSFYKSVGIRARRLGYGVKVRRILVGRNKGKLEVFRVS